MSISAPNDLMVALFEVRVVVMVELESFSNEYRQMMLSPEQFKAVSDILRAQCVGQGDEVFRVPLKPGAIVKLPEEIHSHYSQSEINKAI